MSALVVGGITVPVSTDGAKESPTFLGDRSRMQDGSMRVLIVGTGWKSAWPIVTTLMDDADAATLKAVLKTTSLPVACSGTILGGSVNCIPDLTSYDPVFADGVLKRRVSFTLNEV